MEMVHPERSLSRSGEHRHAAGAGSPHTRVTVCGCISRPSPAHLWPFGGEVPYNQQKLAPGVQVGWLSLRVGAELLGALLQPHSGWPRKLVGRAKLFLTSRNASDAPGVEGEAARDETM